MSAVDSAGYSSFRFFCALSFLDFFSFGSAAVFGFTYVCFPVINTGAVELVH